MQMQAQGSPDKIVVVSNYTTTLSVLGALLAKQEILYVRLDG